MRNWEKDSITLNGCLYGKDNLNELLKPYESSDLWNSAIYNFLEDWFDKSATITVHTSGSTGKPKDIQLTKTAMRNSARMTNAFFGLNTHSIALLCLPADYIAGKMMLVRAIEGQFNLITVEPNAKPFANLNQSIDFTAITPYQLAHSLEDIKLLENKKIEIGKIIVGGAKINSETEAFVQQLNVAVFETYGMTETCSHIALRAVNGQNKSEFFSVLEGIAIRKNENNCLCIKAPHILSEELITNDIVELVDDNHFKIIGRLDNIINSGGVKINPETIEKKLEKHINKPFFITSLPDEFLGSKVVLVIELATPSMLIQAEMKIIIDSFLEKFERPKEIIIVPRFCYSATNKLLKSETLALRNNNNRTYIS